MTAARTKSGIEPDLIRELAQLLKETDLTEIEVEHGELRIRVARQIHVNATLPATLPAAPAHPAPPPMAMAAAAPAAQMSAPAAGNDIALHPGTVKSPMVGTAYLGAAPGAKPFVEIGSKVSQGDRVMIVEAMKTFNDIIAPHAGTVTKLFIEDKQPVEYGQPLMIIE